MIRRVFLNFAETLNNNHHTFFMRRYLILGILMFTTASLISCDPPEQFTCSSAISARVENRTGTSLWVECNWGCDDTGSVYDVTGLLSPGYNCRVWKEVKFSPLIVDAYDFFLPYLEKNFTDAKVSIYAYDELNKSKGEHIKTWRVDEVSEETLFSLENTDIWTDYYDRPGSHIHHTFWFMITNDLIASAAEANEDF